jgi:hypothetical protein
MALLQRRFFIQKKKKRAVPLQPTEEKQSKVRAEHG